MYAFLHMVTVLDCGEPPLLKNGDVIVNTTTVNNTAEYFCVEGFRQKEDTVHVIQCQNDGTWTQPDIECVNGKNFLNSTMLWDFTSQCMLVW